MKLHNRIVKELLVIGINRRKSEFGCSQGCGETEVIFDLRNALETTLRLMSLRDSVVDL